MQSLFLIRFQAMVKLSLKEFMQIGQMNSQKIGKIILVNILLRLYNALPLQVIKKILAICILLQILQKFYMKRI